MDLMSIGRASKESALVLKNLPSGQKNDALYKIADFLVARKTEILEENARDVALAREKGLGSALIDRLTLNDARIDDMADAVRKVAGQKDPIGEVISMPTMESGLRVGKMRVPLGVIGIIYEARPNVTVDAAVLCLKAGNAVILRGGSEAINSNIILTDIMQAACGDAGLPDGAIQLIRDTARETATELMRLSDYLDVLIPRGGVGLIKTVVQNATVPVIETGVGNCHVYIEKSADPKMALDITVNAKTSRPAVCNAAEKLLIDAEIAANYLPDILAELEKNGVELRGCEKTCTIWPGALPAAEEDWYTEYHDYIMAVKIVDGPEQAIAHINKYSSHHSDAIVTNDYTVANRFHAEVDSAAVYVNASTRFTDGGEFGLGAEIGISTQKMHARGPMGIEALTSIKYIIFGSGQVR